MRELHESPGADTDMKRVLRRYRLGEEPDDCEFWQTRSYEERIRALEKIREEYNSWRYNADQQRFQRVYRVVKQERG